MNGSWARPVLPDSIVITEQFVDAELKSVFQTLERKYDLRLAYDEGAVSGIRVTCRLSRVGVRTAFERLLRGTPFDFRIVDERHVMIRLAGLGGSDPAPAPAGITLRGRVVDALSGEALPFAAVLALTGATGVETAADGSFALTMPSSPEGIALQVHYLGYYPRIVRLGAAPPAALTIALHPQIAEIPTITVAESMPLLSIRATTGQTRLDAALTDNLPAFAGGRDLFRTLQLLPGIGAADDLSAGLQIRGGDSGDNLILLDGMTLYRVDHFYGIFSAINPDIVGRTDLYKNAFPARFGGRTAGVLDMGSRQLAGPALRGGAELNLLTSNAYLEAPLAANLHLLLGGRISNGDISGSPLFDLANQERTATRDRNMPAADRLTTLSRDALLARTPDFRFYDANARLVWQPEAGVQLAASFFRGFDRYDNNYEYTFTNVLRQRRVTNGEIYREGADWTNSGLSLQGEWRPGARAAAFLTLSRSSFRNDNDLYAALTRRTNLRSDTISVANANENGITGYDLHGRFEWSAGAGQRLSAGWQSQHQAVDVRLGVDTATVLREAQPAWEHSLYGEWDGRLSDEWSLRAGLRGTYYSPTGKVYLSPRLQLGFSLPGDVSLRASWSRYNQFLREVDYENRFGAAQPFFVLAGERFPVATAGQWAIGAAYTGAAFAVDVEYFDRRLDGALEYALLLTGFSPGQEAPARQLNYISFVGEGRTRGLDVLLRKTDGPYTGWIAYTLSKSTNAFARILRGQSFPAANDRRHQLKIVNQYQLRRWQFSAVYVYASGRPYTDLADLARLRLPPTERGDLPIEDRISYLADYHRLDIGVSYTLPLGRSTLQLGLSCFNLLDNANVKYRQYIFSIPESPLPNAEENTVIGNELQLLGRTLNLSAGWKF